MSEHHRIGDLVPGQLRHPAEILAHHLRVDRIGLRIGRQLVGRGGEVGEVGAHRFDQEREGVGGDPSLLPLELVGDELIECPPLLQRLAIDGRGGGRLEIFECRLTAPATAVVSHHGIAVGSRE